MSRTEPVYDLMVLGSGFAGMAAALFASRRGLSVVQTGAVGGTDFSSGCMDLMGVHPVADGTRWDDPWAAIRACVRDEPQHPYALVREDDIRVALDEFTSFLGRHGQPYAGRGERNLRLVTPAGTIKRSYRVPASYLDGTDALEGRLPTLLVDFHGLKGYSARQIIEVLGARWPGLRSARVRFPDAEGEILPEQMAWTLADAAGREELVARISAHLDGVDAVGFPAVLGIYDPTTVVDHLRELTGKRVFEVPTLPPAIAGLRLRAAFERGAEELGVRVLDRKLVHKARREVGGGFEFQVGKGTGATLVRARAALLAGGRFFGKGLTANRHHAVETVFGLPVAQPASRSEWHAERFLDPGGHALNRAGLETDDRLRPLVSDGRPVFPNLFAAGAILAHQDWMRAKCGACLAVATAYKAVGEAARG